MSTPEEREQLEAQAEPGRFLTQLANIIGAHVRATTVFAPPVREDGVTIIPVAKATWGVGGGTGRHAQRGERGAAGGGGMVMKPVGFIAISRGRARFRRLLDPALIAAAAVAGATAALVALRAGGLWHRRR